MVRLILLSALLVSWCDQNKGAGSGSTPPPGFLAPTLKCTLLAPAGWTTSPSPMPDHVVEVIATAPGLRGRMVVKEARAATVAEAAEEQMRRTVASWGTQPDFTLLREDPLGEGRVVLYQWRPQASAPMQRHLIALLPRESKVILTLIDDDGATSEAQLLETVNTLKCSPR